MFGFRLAPTALVLALVFLACVAGCGGKEVGELSVEERALARVVETRRRSFKELGAAFKSIRDELEAGRPQNPAVGLSARSVRNYAQELPTWFPAGSGPELGVATGARAVIWEDTPRFEELARRLAASTETLLEATRGGSGDDVTAAFRATGEVCETCHETFRHKDS